MLKNAGDWVYSHVPSLGFVAKGDVLMRCLDDISCFLSVVRFRNEI